LNFSLLMSVYVKDDPEHLSIAFKSILDSTVKPDEVVLVEDGPIGISIEKVIEEFNSKLPVKIIKMPQNVGLGRALRAGLEHCDNEWIARFDSDDVCVPTRFEQQASFIEHNPEIDILGSWVSEFEINFDCSHAVKKTPDEHESIVRFAKKRNPFNHMTVMYRKSSVLAAGGYQDDYLYEDYALWVRMIQNGCLTANIPEVLVHARTGNGMEVRRGGVKYAKSEVKAQYNFYKLGFISLIELIKNLAIRVPVRLLPGSFRKFIYRKTLRR
jgi:glycosyltransferase involved in cell wall biosynthesis